MERDPMTIRPAGRVPGATRRVFWERKAGEYTSPFDERMLSWTEKVIGIAERRGVIVDGMRLLDIGCGTGGFALPLAQRGASVTGLDFSGNMLKRLAAESERLGIENVRTVRNSWKTIDLAGAGLEGAFDIVISALSTAVETVRDILKMERCSTRWCIYVASGKVSRSKACREMLLAIGAPLDPRPDIRDMKKRLESMGRRFIYESFTNSVEYEKSVEDAVKELAGRLEAAGVNPDMKEIGDAVRRCRAGAAGRKGMIRYRRCFDTGILIWRVDEG
ncbi:MAG: Mg-protoporphyrin IX methyl transferase [Syntrophorhabdus sp. PtaB.Bin047]|jgi:SAM-dependent methyltransferase|nr:MAG: Mg-protoporphyrin IX methyl transferase [Syntrophorhabdus sp. PtaB.Bin047]